MIKRDKNDFDEVSNTKINTDNTESLLETDLAIQTHIKKRKEENKALKKLLENLNTSIPKTNQKNNTI
jgi:hypothetical protein